MIVYRASELGRCVRASVADRLGLPAAATPGWLQRMYDGGVEHEDACIEAMSAAGWSVVNQQMEVTIPITDDIAVVGHLDGTCIEGEEYVYPAWPVLEVKSPHSWSAWEKAHLRGDYSDPLIARYGWQISCYMQDGREAVIACLDDGIIRTFRMEVPPYNLYQIKQRVSVIENCVAIMNAGVGIIPSLPNCSQNDGAGCPYRGLEGGLCYRSEIIEFDPVLEELAYEYEMHKEQEKTAKKWARVSREKIMAHLGDRESVVTDSWKITRYETPEKTYTTTRKASTGLRVTKREDGDEDNFGSS